MFLNLSVSHSVHRGGGVCFWVWGCTPPGRHPLPQTATAADGTLFPSLIKDMRQNADTAQDHQPLAVLGPKTMIASTRKGQYLLP